MSLSGKVAIVTGASRGIGRGIALTLAREGATVIINDIGPADEVVKEIEANGGKAEAFCCDVNDFEAVKDFVAEVVKHYERVDILVNNAGITRDNLIMKMTKEDFDAVVGINLGGTFNCIKAVTRTMMKQRVGRIINISSVSGITGNMGQANYSASKAGVIGLTKSSAKELAARNITVNAIAPGFIDTDMTAVLPEAVKENAVAQIPLKAFGKIEDIAETVAFLASDKAKYITGQVICIDGGLAM